MKTIKIKEWIHIKIENGKWVKRWFRHDRSNKKNIPECVGSISVPLELARTHGLK